MTKASPVDKTRHEMGRLERALIIHSALDGLVAGVLVKLIVEYYLKVVVLLFSESHSHSLTNHN